MLYLSLSAPVASTLSIVPNANFGSRKRVVCALCDGPHDEDDCHKRGLPFMPPSMAKKVLRYNEIHGSVPKVPKKDLIQKPFQPRHKNTTAPTANMALVSVPILDPSPISDPPTTSEDEITTVEVEETNPPAQDSTNHHIKPSAGLAEFKNVDSDYMEYIFSLCICSFY